MNILSAREVVKITNLSRVSLWRYERHGLFPSRLRLGPNRVGWLQSEVEDWLRARPRGMAYAENENSPNAGSEAVEP